MSMQVAELLKLYRLQQGDVMQTVAFQLYVTNVIQSCGIAKLLRALFNLHRQKTGTTSIFEAGDSTGSMQD